MNISWEKPEYFWLLLLLPLVVCAFYYLWNWRKKVRSAFADRHLWSSVFYTEKTTLWSPSIFILIVALLLIILSIVGPMWGEEEQSMQRKGVDLVIALDVSNSMNAEDIAPSRLEKAKLFIQKFLDKLGGDRVGLIIFAGDAYTVSPLTNDYTALSAFVKSIDTNLLWTQGTDTGLAIREAVEILDEKDLTSKALVLISDGENHEKDLPKAIRIANDKNLMIFTFGVGSTIPSPIPMYQNGQMIGYKEDSNGTTVLSRFHGDNLATLAQDTEGSYHKIEDIESAVQALMNDLSGLEKRSLSETSVFNAKHQFQWFTGFALLLLIAYTLFSENLKFKKE